VRISFQFGFLLLALVGFCLPASAIVVADYGVATNAPTGDWDLDWDYVYKYKNSSSVAIGSHWLLTAAHVGDDGALSTIVIDGVSYYQQQAIFHAAVDDPQHASKADLALVRYDKALPGYYSLYTGSFPTQPSKKLDAVMVGYGRVGTVYSTYYTEAVSGNGVKRWGTQKIDGTATADYDGGGTTGMTYNDGMQMLFTLSNTTYEAGVGTYDSGGGTFVEDGGVWKLAGINTTRYSGTLGFTGTFAVSVPAYETWATQMIDSVTGDADSDGIPNWWEEQFGTNILASIDQDGDGFIGEEEYFSDTDPTDSTSFWQVEGTITSADQTFTFEGSTARQYQLFYTTNSLAVTNLIWTAHGSAIWGAGSNTTLVVTNTENMVFYRMQTILP